MIRARSCSEASSVSVAVAVTPPAGLDLGETGLQLYLPASILDGVAWRFRADNLCAWEGGLRRRLASRPGPVVSSPQGGDAGRGPPDGDWMSELV